MDDSDKIYQAAPTISQMGLSINDPNYFLDQVPEKKGFKSFNMIY